MGETGITLHPPSSLTPSPPSGFGCGLPFAPDKITAALAAKTRRRRGRLHLAAARPVVDRHHTLGISARPVQMLHRQSSTRTYRSTQKERLELDQPADLDGLRSALAAGAAPLGGGGDLHVRRRTDLLQSRLAAVPGTFASSVASSARG